jgi:hypothetical protein
MRAIYKFGGYRIDTSRFEISRDGRPLAAEPQVLELLITLIDNRDRVVSKDELLERIWKGRMQGLFDYIGSAWGSGKACRSSRHRSATTRSFCTGGESSSGSDWYRGPSAIWSPDQALRWKTAASLRWRRLSRHGTSSGRPDRRQ